MVNLEEQVYLEHPVGYKVKVHGYKIYRLKKGVYFVEHTPRYWYNDIDSI